MKQVTFITGNQNKADYLARLLNVPIGHKKIDLDELQLLDLNEIVSHKAKQAYRRLHSPVLVEDQSLEFVALNGLPGPYVKFFVETTGLEAMCRMLDGFSDRSAITHCVYGYYDGSKLVQFEARLKGKIAMHPAGESGWGWDKIFIPEGYGGRTRGELSEQEDKETYLKIKPINAVREFLQKQ